MRFVRLADVQWHIALYIFRWCYQAQRRGFSLSYACKLELSFKVEYFFSEVVLNFVGVSNDYLGSNEGLSLTIRNQRTQ